MSIRQGNKIISGGDRLPGWGTPLLSCMWADHKLNSVSWLRADTFSWQSGNIYISAYNHLVEDLHDSATTIHTEVISGNNITYYLTPDKHRICLADQAQVVDAIYQATGISWYFILDENQKRFKLPRTKWGFTGLRNAAGESIEAGLPNITGDIVVYTATGDNCSASGAFEKFDGTGRGESYQFVGNNQGYSFDASRSSSVYGKSTTVQPPATEMYLYFYVGNFDVNKDILDTAKLSELVNEFNITEFEAEVQESKNKAISEISTIYPEVAKYPGMVTNCITEIPQVVNVVLKDGVLTLKAGSKSYRCDGTITTASKDIETTITVDGQYFLYMETSTYITRTFVDKTISSATEPANPTNLSGYFNTTDNKVYKYSGGWGEEPLPFAIVTVTGGAISSIDHIFNGFGYVGTTMFTLPGVKVLMPNGRNADGTLKNGKIENNTVKYTTITTRNMVVIPMLGNLNFSPYINVFYDEEKNILYNNANPQIYSVPCGSIVMGANNIVSFNIDTVFRAADYNDLVKKQDAATSVNYGNITNCITEIPQDIKLEIVDGVLTLKAGSKVYIPDGPNSFKKKTATADVITPTGTYSGKFMIFDNGNLSGNTLRVCGTPHLFSGTTAPSSPQVDTTWYDTTNNIVKVYQNSQWTGQRTLPLAIATFDAGACVSIDQVFNGFGYIGSTVFALPDVKALIPDGRNEDGTLKNTVFTVNSVKTIGYATAYNDYTISLSASSIGIWVAGRLVYDEQTNHNVNTQNNSIQAMTICGTVSCDGTRITSFEPKTAFHAVDYNDTDFISYQAMPSKRYVDFTVLAHGSYYTAPADGYFVVALLTGGGVTSSSIGLRNGSNEIGNQTYISNTNGSYYASVPVSKGDKVQGFYYGQDTTKLTVRFVYTNSAK